jgi:hypothetical protein
MMRNPRFWAFMVVFQLLFGLSVFALTRQYYLGAQAQAVAAAARQPAPPTRNEDTANPHKDLRNNPTGDLAELMSSFPGQAPAQDPAALARQGDRILRSSATIWRRSSISRRSTPARATPTTTTASVSRCTTSVARKRRWRC